MHSLVTGHWVGLRRKSRASKRGKSDINNGSPKKSPAHNTNYALCTFPKHIFFAIIQDRWSKRRHPGRHLAAHPRSSTATSTHATPSPTPPNSAIKHRQWHPRSPRPPQQTENFRDHPQTWSKNPYSKSYLGKYCLHYLAFHHLGQWSPMI